MAPMVISIEPLGPSSVIRYWFIMAELRGAAIGRQRQATMLFGFNAEV
jgi:hypothetical protein